MATPNIQINEVAALSATNLVTKLHDAGETKLRNEGSIRVGSKTYKVTYVKGDDGVEKLQMKRHYTGFLIGPLLNLCKRSSLTTQSTALRLNDKIAELMKSTDYQIARNTYDKLMEIANTHKGDANGVIEVGNYGHSEPRKKIMSMGVVEAVNKKLEASKSGKSIRLNMIDTYNTFLGVTVGTLMPDKYAATMKKIAGGGLKINEGMLDNDGLYTVEREDLEQWRAYISNPEIAAKIDIPKKLHAYLHQGEATGNDGNLVGWKKDFQLNPDTALRNFVIKNMPASFMREGKLNDEVINKMCGKLRSYVEIYNMEDGPAKQAQLDDFFDFANWECTDADTARIEQAIKDVIAEKADKGNMDEKVTEKRFGKAITESFYKGKPCKAMKNLESYVLFSDILMYATFRQTSKIGLDFFKSQGKPILFHTSDRKSVDFGDMTWIKGENHWKSGQLDPTYGGSEITHSEIRHATKLIEKYGDGTDGADLWFVKGAQP